VNLRFKFAYRAKTDGFHSSWPLTWSPSTVSDYRALATHFVDFIRQLVELIGVCMVPSAYNGFEHSDYGSGIHSRNKGQRN
jgi:hypothetical protein